MVSSVPHAAVFSLFLSSKLEGVCHLPDEQKKGEKVEKFLLVSILFDVRK